MIIYFSGTGNSLAVAKEVAKKHSEQVTPMRKAMNDGSEHIIFIFPTFCFDVPKYVRDFITSFEFKPNQKVMGISVSGGDNGNSQRTFEKLIQNKGLTVSKFKNVAMVDNSMPILIGSTIGKKEVSLEEIAKAFWEEDVIPKSRFNPLTKVADKLFNTKYASKLVKKKLIDEKCTRCGVCESICPTGNITLENNKLVIGNTCGECFGCIHVCPKQAIYIRKPIDVSKQYRNKTIKISELNK